jgi:hypothetical protein
MIYLIRHLPDIYITEIDLNGKALFVRNESSERFERGLASGKVRALTPIRPGRELPVDSAKR